MVGAAADQPDLSIPAPLETLPKKALVS